MAARKAPAKTPVRRPAASNRGLPAILRGEPNLGRPSPGVPGGTSAPTAPTGRAPVPAANRGLPATLPGPPNLGRPTPGVPGGTSAPPAAVPPAAVTAPPTMVGPSRPATGDDLADRYKTPFVPTGTPTPPVDPAAANVQVALDAAHRDAQAQIMDTLNQYGLGSLSGFVWNELVNGRSGNEILQDVRATPEFGQRFPAIAQRQAAGLPPISPGDYVAYENAATQAMRNAGLPAGFYDSRDDFTGFLTNDVSLKELNERIDMARQAASDMPPEAVASLRSQFGLGQGDLAAYFLDPQRAEPILTRNLAAATLSGTASRTGWGQLTADQATRLAQQGVSADQARTGFDQLGLEQQLFNPLPGHAGEQQIGADQQLAAQFSGDASVQLAIEQRRQQRLADFNDSSAFAASKAGQTGAGQQIPT